MAELRQTIRRLFRVPAFTLTTVLTLAIAIGATTAIFSVVNGILLKPLPFPESERLVALRHRLPALGRSDWAASPAIYFTYREHTEVFESVALYTYNRASVTGADEPEEVRRLLATHELLGTLGVTPLLGRGFTAADDQEGNPPVAMLSYGYWQRRLGGTADALGRTVIVDGAPHEIIGVLPPDFRFLEQPAEIVAPARPSRLFAFVPSFGERGIARLKPGVTLAEASADVRRMIPILYETFPMVPGMTRQQLDGMGFGPSLRFLKDDVVGELDDVLWVLMGTIVMLLLVACANVANLALVQAETRAPELALRAALGAGRTTIAGGLLLEAALLGIVGGAIGLGLAAASLPQLLSFAAKELPDTLAVAIDARVLAFALALSVGCPLLFGAIPIVKYAAPRISALLRTAGRGYGASRERHRARNSLVIVQVALALVLLVASGLMIRTFEALRDVNPGFAAADQIQTFRISIPQAMAPEFERVVRMQNDLEDRLAAVPGVESVGFSSGDLPLLSSGPSQPFLREDRPDAASILIDYRYVSPGFSRTLGTPLVAGRELEWSDYYDGARRVAAVSEALARREWGSTGAALGKRLRRGGNGEWLEIAGVVADVRHHGLDRPAPDTIYVTSREDLAQFASRSVEFFVRSNRAGTAGFLDDVQQAVWSVNPDLPLGSVHTLGEIYGGSMARTSLTLVLLGIMGAMSLLLGLVGIYGVIAYVVVQRRRELGIRIALGAPGGALQRMLLRQVLLLVGAGVALGIGGAALLTRLMESLLFGVMALDPVTYVVVAAVLVVTGALAGYLPARRATRVDPMAALRAD
jgi:predicted permease